MALQLAAVNASGRERIDLDLGAIKAFGTIQWFALVKYRKRKHSLQPISAVSSNVVMRGVSSPCSACLCYGLTSGLDFGPI